MYRYYYFADGFFAMTFMKELSAEKQAEFEAKHGKLIDIVRA